MVKDSKNSFESQLNISGWDNNWYLVQDHIYLLKVFIYDRDKHPLVISDNLVINSIVDKEHFDIIL